MKWNLRCFANVTFDFEIEAETEEEVEAKAKQYLPYIDCGRLPNQPISVKVGDKDKLTGIFVMDLECEDIYDL